MKAIKFLLKTFLILVLTFVIFWIAAFLVLQTTSGQKWATKKVIALVEKQTNSKIELEEVYFEFPLTVQLKNLSLFQEDKPWIVIDDLRMCCLYPSLLDGHLVLSKAHLDGLHLLAIPSSTSAATDQMQELNKEGEEINWERAWLPMYTDIQDIRLTQMTVSETIVNDLEIPDTYKNLLIHSFVNLSGSFTNHPLQDLIGAHFTIDFHDAQTDTIPATLLAIVDQNELTLVLEAKQLKLPDMAWMNTQGFFEITGRLNQWQSLLTKNSKTEEPLIGQFNFLINAIEKNTLLATLIGPATIMNGGFSLSSLDVIDLTHFIFDSPFLQMEANTQILSTQKEINGQFSGMVTHLDNLQEWTGEKIEGNLVFNGFFEGPITDPQLKMTIDSPFLAFSTHVLHQLQIKFESQAFVTKKNGLLTSSFIYKEIPFKLSSALDFLNEKVLTFSDLRLDTRQSKLNGTLDYFMDSQLFSGRLHASLRNLKEFATLTQEPLQGSLEADVNLSIDENVKPASQLIKTFIKGDVLSGKDFTVNHLQLTLESHLSEIVNPSLSLFQIKTQIEATDVQWKEVKFAQCSFDSLHLADPLHQNIPDWRAHLNLKDISNDSVSVQQVNTAIHLNDLKKVFTGEIEWDIKGVKQGDLTITQLAGSSKIGPPKSLWPYTIKAEGHLNDDWALDFNGNWTINENETIVEVNNLNGQIKELPLILSQPVKWTQNDLMTELTPLQLRLGESDFTIDYKQNAEGISGHLQTTAIPTQFIQIINPKIPFDGKATIRADLSGTLDKPLVKALISLDHLQLIHDQLTHQTYLDGDMEIEINPNGTKINSTLNGIGKIPLTIKGEVPYALTLNPMAIVTNPKAALNVAINADGDIDHYLQLVGYDSENISGQLTVAMQVKGQIEAPQIEGYANLKDGVYETANTGAIYRNIQARIEGNGSTLNLKNFTAQDNQKGTITGNGQLSLNKSKNFPFKINIQLNQIYVVDADYATMDVSGPLSIEGTLKKPKIKGNVTVNHAVVRMEETLPSEVKNVEVTYINIPHGETVPQSERAKEKASPIELEIKIDVPSTLSIEGSRLTSTWKGSIILTGTPANMLLNGDLRIDKGEFNITGKVFTLSQGTIHFAGSPGKKTSLYIVASKDIERIRAEIILKGFLTKPSVTFRSNPPLPQREVLSYILFNRGLSDITSDQGDQLNQSFIELSTSKQSSNSDDFLTRMRNNVGIDRLDLTRGDGNNNDFSLQVGKYITESIYVSFNKGINSTVGANRVAIEANVFKNVKAQAEVGIGQDSPARMSLKWHKDY